MARFYLQLGQSFCWNIKVFRQLHAVSGQTNDVDKLWRDFFSDPSQWRDHRSEKVDPKYPDFEHKYSQESLWLDSRLNPPWVAAEMTTIAPVSAVQRTRIDSEPLRAKSKVEKLWEKFFSDPSKWWDNTSEKPNPKFPDFKHKDTLEALWLVDKRNPPWVASLMASISPGVLQKHAFSWARKLSKSYKAEQYELTIKLFEEMQQEGIIADRYVFVPVLKACARLQALDKGRSIHAQAVESGCELDPYVSNCLVDMYAKCGSLDEAWSVFDKMPKHDVYAWNALIFGHVNSGQGLSALDLYHQMKEEGVEPDSFTFVGLLNACGATLALEEGRWVHGLIRRSVCETHPFVGSSLVDMYAKCGSVEDALIVFNKMPTRDLVAWTAMILGHAKCGESLKALQLFQQMQSEGIEPDSVTFVGLLNACASIKALEEGRNVHKEITRSGLESDEYVGCGLVNMYAKCGSLDDASKIFSNMPTRSLVAWNAMILLYVNCGQGQKALDLFEQMQSKQVQPDAVTFVGLLNACASLPALKEGRRVHRQIRRIGYESDKTVSSSLVDMYAKCGSIDNAWTVFNNMPSRDVAAWNAMIEGHVNCGEARKVHKLFQQMEHEGVEPNSSTFVGLLKACAATCALKEGLRVHRQIRRRGYESDEIVCTSLVSMYARCGSMDRARRVFNKMSTQDVTTWNAMVLDHLNPEERLIELEVFKKMPSEKREPEI